MVSKSRVLGIKFEVMADSQADSMVHGTTGAGKDTREIFLVAGWFS